MSLTGHCHDTLVETPSLLLLSSSRVALSISTTSTALLSVAKMFKAEWSIKMLEGSKSPDLKKFFFFFANVFMWGKSHDEKVTEHLS